MIATFAEYQALAARTHSGHDRPRDAQHLTIDALGIAGEAGEVADYIKKVVGHGHTLDHDKIAKELGDVLWYVAALADDCGLSLDEIATANIDKLRARYPEGFSTEASIARVDVTVKP